MEKLFSREGFLEQVMRRHAGKCAFCTHLAIDAHHILDRKLFPDGGYYLNNGAAVCEAHHWLCETTEFTVEQVREAAKITVKVLPPGFDANKVYDKWGNEIIDHTRRKPGPLAEDTGCRKALTHGKVIWQLY
jgi:hypothetical protein